MECHFCNNVFNDIGRFERHVCEQMVRASIMDTHKGVKGYNNFVIWYEAQHRSKCVVDKEQFSKSGFFHTFVNMVDLFKFLHIDNPRDFIEYMTSIGISPKLWNDLAIYNLYFMHLDNLPPDVQYEFSISTLRNLAEHFNCSTIDEVFTNLTLGDIRDLVKRHLLSPWLLLICDTFTDLYEQANSEVQKSFSKSIQLDKWITKYENNPIIAKILSSRLKKEQV
jgi:hypothetical protein